MEENPKFRSCKKKFLETSKLIVFSCKLYRFILSERKKEYIEELYEHAGNIDKNYNNLIKYFKKIGNLRNF